MSENARCFATRGSRLCARGGRAWVVCPRRSRGMSGLDDEFLEWIEAVRGGKRCPDEARPLFEAMYKDSPVNFMSCTVKSRETSNPAMDTEVWRLVLEESSTAAGIKLAAMVAIAARTWAASPPDGMMATSPSVTSVTKSVVTLGANAPSTGTGTLVEGPWGVVLSADEKDALDVDKRADVREQKAPGVDALVILSVSMMLGRKCGVAEAQGAQYGQDPMMAVCFKQLAKLQSVSATKPLGRKLEDAKKSKDMTAVETHMDKLGDSLMKAGEFGVAKARAVMRMWKDISTMDESRPMLGIFWLERYLEECIGRGLPPLWESKMIFDATKAHDAYYAGKEGGGGGNGSRPPPRSSGDGGQTGTGGNAFETKVLEKLDNLGRETANLRQSHASLSSNVNRMDSAIKALQKGEEPPADPSGRTLGPCHRCGQMGHNVTDCPKGKKAATPPAKE